MSQVDGQQTVVEGVTIPDATCSCGARLRAVPSWDMNDWDWVDEDGHKLVDRSPEGYRDDPKGWWARLAAEDIATYSDLSCRAALGMLGWTHGHRPAQTDSWTGGEVPRCCDMPMRLTPRGWVCREARERG